MSKLTKSDKILLIITIAALFLTAAIDPGWFEGFSANLNAYPPPIPTLVKSTPRPYPEPVSPTATVKPTKEPKEKEKSTPIPEPTEQPAEEYRPTSAPTEMF